MQDITQQIGDTTHDIAAKVDEYGRGMIRTNRSTLFEELGLLLHRSSRWAQHPRFHRHSSEY